MKYNFSQEISKNKHKIIISDKINKQITSKILMILQFVIKDNFNIKTI